MQQPPRPEPGPQHRPGPHRPGPHRPDPQPRPAPAEATAALDPDDVAAWLRANPDFLARTPTLYDALDPPHRVHGPALADHMAALLLRARTRAAIAERAATEAASTRRAAASFARRVQETVLALMRAPDPAWLATNELASLLRLDAARICAETSPAPSLTTPLTTPGTTPVPPGTIADALGHRTALVRPTPVRAARASVLLHGEAVALATEEALVRIPLRTGRALLALACRDTVGLAGAGTDALTFLGEAVAAALERPNP